MQLVTIWICQIIVKFKLPPPITKMKNDIKVGDSYINIMHIRYSRHFTYTTGE